MKSKYRLVEVGEVLTVDDFLCEEGNPEVCKCSLMPTKEVREGRAKVNEYGVNVAWPYGFYGRRVIDVLEKERVRRILSKE